MTLIPTEASAPGKLMIAGEYAVLEPGEPAIVAALDRALTARIEPAETFTFSSESLAVTNWPVTYENGRWNLQAGPSLQAPFVAAAVNTTLVYLRGLGKAIAPFSLFLIGRLESASGAKYGFGSSAAVTVATIGALLGACDVRPDTEQVFKLAVLAHLGTQGNGSGADLAASVFGGVLRFVSFDHAWLFEQDRLGTPLAHLIEADWPILGIEPLPWPGGLELAIGFTGQPASTAPLIQAVSSVRQSRSSDYARFLVWSRQAVNSLAAALRDEDPAAALSAIAQARAALDVLQGASGVVLETPMLKVLAEAATASGGAGKLSGAGGGDCGFGVFLGAHERREAEQAWRNAGIEVMEAAIAPTGLIIRQS
jgi:phosphomevalonate kinase